MNFLLILFLCAGVVTCFRNNEIPVGEDAKLCPPPESIAPCTCFKAPVTERLTAHCSNFTNAYEIKAIFDRNQDWEIQDILIDNSTMSHIPALMLEGTYFRSVNISSTSLLTLFDGPPVRTQPLDLHLNDVRLERGFKWRSISRMNLVKLSMKNMTMKNLGNKFKENISKEVQSLTFENTGMTSIKNQAFSHLQKLDFLALRRGYLKKVSRDMFPRPWNVVVWDLSFQKISDLPKDIFSDLPKLSNFFIEGNVLTTISEKVFIKYQVNYNFHGNPINCNCNIKWIIGKLQPENLYGECAQPLSLKGTKLGSLKEDDLRYCQ